MHFGVWLGCTARGWCARHSHKPMTEQVAAQPPTDSRHCNFVLDIRDKQTSATLDSRLLHEKSLVCCPLLQNRVSRFHYDDFNCPASRMGWDWPSSCLRQAACSASPATTVHSSCLKCCNLGLAGGLSIVILLDLDRILSLYQMTRASILAITASCWSAAHLHQELQLPTCRYCDSRLGGRRALC